MIGTSSLQQPTNGMMNHRLILTFISKMNSSQRRISSCRQCANKSITFIEPSFSLSIQASKKNGQKFESSMWWWKKEVSVEIVFLRETRKKCNDIIDFLLQWLLNIRYWIDFGSLKASVVSNLSIFQGTLFLNCWR